MIIDKRLQVASLLAIPDGTALRSDVIDLGAGQRLIGPGDPLWWVIVARVALAGTSPTLDLSIQSDDNTSFSSPTTLLAYPQQSAFALGARLVIPHPWSPLNERYLSILFDLGGTGPTLTVDAFLTNQDPASWVSYPDAI